MVPLLDVSFHRKVKYAARVSARSTLSAFIIAAICTIILLVATIMKHPNPVQVTDVAELSFGGVMFFTSTVNPGSESTFATLQTGPGVLLLLFAFPLIVGSVFFVRALYHHDSFVPGVD